jgi:hypothetical protein
LSVLLLLGAGPLRPEPEGLHYYVQLVWGTNHSKPDDAGFRLVGPKLKQELSRVFQWQQYWETNQREATVRAGAPAKIRLSPDCAVEIELVEPTVREIRIYGKGVLVTRARRHIHCRNLAIHGGAIETGGSWFVVVRDDKPEEN